MADTKKPDYKPAPLPPAPPLPGSPPLSGSHDDPDNYRQEREQRERGRKEQEKRDHEQHLRDKNDERDDAERGRDERGRDERVREEHGGIANRDQDPDHPANTTQARDLNAPTTFSIPPEDMMTEQEKLAAGAPDDATAGVGPFNPAEHTTGPVETIADQGIGPRTPYPTGNPPPPEQTTTMSQGIKGVSDRPHREPGEAKDPAGHDDEQAREHPANPGPFDPPRQHKVPSP